MRRDPALRAATTGAALLLVLGLLPLPVIGGSAPVAHAPGPGPTAAGAARLLPTVIRHVILVMEENRDRTWTLSDPGFRALYSANAHVRGAYAVCHPSAPSYIALTSAALPQCGSNALQYYALTNLASSLAAHHRSWQGLMQSMPKPCDRSNAYPYAAGHDPWVYYSNLRASCATHDLPFFTAAGSSRLKTEIAAGTLPALTFVTPDLLHDAHDGSLATASAWLAQKVLAPLHRSLVYSADTAVFVTFDEAYNRSCNCSENGGYTSGGVTLSGGPVYLIVISPIPPLSLPRTLQATSLNVVHTTEWLLGLPGLGHDDNASFPILRGLFR